MKECISNGTPEGTESGGPKGNQDRLGEIQIEARDGSEYIELMHDAQPMAELRRDNANVVGESPKRDTDVTSNEARKQKINDTREDRR